eukprot:763560-Hanusia_phi.AAC.2
MLAGALALASRMTSSILLCISGALLRRTLLRSFLLLLRRTHIIESCSDILLIVGIFTGFDCFVDPDGEGTQVHPGSSEGRGRTSVEARLHLAQPKLHLHDLGRNSKPRVAHWHLDTKHNPISRYHDQYRSKDFRQSEICQNSH